MSAEANNRLPAVEAQLEERIALELARRHPRYLAPVCFTTDQKDLSGRPLRMEPESFHVEWLNAAVERRETLLLAARGHAKSEYCSAVCPAWWIGQNPNVRIVHVTSTEALATMYSRRLMNLMVSPKFRQVFPALPLPGKKWTETEWELAIPGRRDPTWRCAGRGQAITGGRADIIVADDVVTLETSRSPGERDRTWEWWGRTLMPMLVPGGKLLIVGTPYNEDDLYQRLRAGNMETMLYPAEDEEGKILWPARFSRQELDKRRIPPGGTPASYASQYLCNPVPEEGAMLKREWWRYYDQIPEVLDVQIASWDMAFKGSDGSDGRSFVVGQVWGRRGVRYYLLDQVRGRWDFVETLDQVRALSRKWPGAIMKLVEDAANGPAVVSALTADVRDGVGGLVPVKVKANESKESRASAVSPLIQAGNVYLPREASWLDGFLRECLAFPNSAYSDQVDALSQALLFWIRNTGLWLEEAERTTIEEDEAEFTDTVDRMNRRAQRITETHPTSGWSGTA